MNACENDCHQHAQCSLFLCGPVNESPAKLKGINSSALITENQGQDSSSPIQALFTR